MIYTSKHRTILKTRVAGHSYVLLKPTFFKRAGASCVCREGYKKTDRTAVFYLCCWRGSMECTHNLSPLASCSAQSSKVLAWILCNPIRYKWQHSSTLWSVPQQKFWIMLTKCTCSIAMLIIIVGFRTQESGLPPTSRDWKCKEFYNGGAKSMPVFE